MKTSGLVGPFLLAILAVVLAVGWRQERQRGGKLAVECQRLSQELSLARNVSANGNEDDPPLVSLAAQPVTAESSLSKPQESANGNEDSNHVTNADEIETNILIRTENIPTTTAQVSLPSATEEEPPYTNLQLEIYRCSNQMGVINFAAERWATDHNGLIPENLMELRGYLSPMVLVCPGVRPKTLSAAWERFQPEDVTYQVLPGSKGKLWDLDIPGPSPVTVGWLRCPVHNLRVLNRKMSAGIPSSQVFQPR